MHSDEVVLRNKIPSKRRMYKQDLFGNRGPFTRFESDFKRVLLIIQFEAFPILEQHKVLKEQQ